MHDLVIRNGTVVDGSGGPVRAPGTADIAVDGDRIIAVGSDIGPGRREHRRRRAPRHAGLRRHPHPLRRPGHLGSRDQPVKLARRHHHRHGQLRRRLRPSRPGQAGVADPAHGGRRGHPRHRPRRGHELELGDVPRVPRRARPHGPRGRRERARPPRRRAGICDGRPRRPERRGDARRDRGNGQGRARGGRGRGGRLLDDPHAVAPRQGRRAGGGHHRQRRRADRHRPGTGRRPLGRVRAGQRHVRSRGRVRLDADDRPRDRPPGHVQLPAGRPPARALAPAGRAGRRGHGRRRSDSPAGGRPPRLGAVRLGLDCPPVRVPPDLANARRPAPRRPPGPPARPRGAPGDGHGARRGVWPRRVPHVGLAQAVPAGRPARVRAGARAQRAVHRRPRGPSRRRKSPTTS